MDFAKTSDEKIIGKKPKSKDGEDITYVYRQVFINELFPFYKLLTNSRSNTIFGITFDKKEIFKKNKEFYKTDTFKRFFL